MVSMMQAGALNLIATNMLKALEIGHYRQYISRLAEVAHIRRSISIRVLNKFSMNQEIS